MSRRQIFWLMLLLGACGTKTTTQSGQGSGVSPATEFKVPKVTGVAIEAANVTQCPYGGSVVLTFEDRNIDGLRDLDEPVLSTVPVCNGASGSNGSDGADGNDGRDGVGAGIVIESASLSACPAGGSIFKTFADTNNNGVLDSGESVSSQSTICNGIAGQNGADGQSAHLTVTAASSVQCPSGGGGAILLEPGPITSKVSVSVSWKKEQIDLARLAKLRWVENRTQRQLAAEFGIGRTRVIAELRKLRPLAKTRDQK